MIWLLSGIVSTTMSIRQLQLLPLLLAFSHSQQTVAAQKSHPALRLRGKVLARLL
jgi:hypothetical protein